MARGRSPNRTTNPIERGDLGTGMMSDKGKMSRDLEQDRITEESRAESVGRAPREQLKDRAD